MRSIEDIPLTHAGWRECVVSDIGFEISKAEKDFTQKVADLTDLLLDVKSRLKQLEHEMD